MAIKKHERWMQEAIKEALVAQENKEVPVGAVVVLHDRLIGRGHNQVETLKDATAHAEMIALTSSSQTLGDWRLNNAILYVTLEPCPMCAGAIRLARISKCVFGTKDPKLSSLGSVYDIKSPGLKVVSGVLEHDCQQLLTAFFKKRRIQSQ